MIDFDVILDHVGNFGRFQAVLCAMVFYLTVSCSMHILAPVFYAAPMSFRCRIPSVETFLSNNNLSYEYELNLTTPFDPKLSKFDGCYRYSQNSTSCNSTLYCFNTNSTPVSCTDGYYYDKLEFTETTVSEWDLVCDRDYLNTIENSLYFLGAMTGGFVAGYVADRFGRKKALLCCSVGIMTFGLITSLVPWFLAFVVTRFFVGMCDNGLDFLTQVYVIEITGRKHTTASILGQVAFGIGLLVNSLFSYFVRSWRSFYLMVSMFTAPYFLFNYFVPESPRWYFSKSQNEAGKKAADKFGKYNRKKITDEIWSEAEKSQKDIVDTSNEKYSALDLFKPKRMRIVTIFINICWFVGLMTYLGLSLNVGSLAGNIFLNNALNGILSVVCAIFLIFTVDRISRRIFMGGSMLLTAASSFGSFIAICFGNNSPVAATIGSVCTFIAYLGSWIFVVLLFMYTAEIYPTVVRSNGLGTATVTGNIGSIMAPIVISSHLPWLPSLVFGILSLIAGILFFLLPETINRSLPETFEEAEMFYAGRTTLRSPDDRGIHNQELTLLSQKETEEIIGEEI